MSSRPSPSIAIIGAGPAGLMAAEVLTDRGLAVDIYDAMPSPARKFLMAGKSGLNITHNEPEETFLSRYTAPDQRLTRMVRGFSALDIQSWMKGLDIPVHVGPTGRVFPQMMKASPLLRAWLARLQQNGARLHTRYRWQGWSDDGGLTFNTPSGPLTTHPAAAILAVGGASWKRLGSDGTWARHLAAHGVPLAPFTPSNCGFLCNWTDHMRSKFAGAPIKSVRLTAPNGQATRGEFVITSRGVESGGIYALSAALVDQIVAEGQTQLSIDLLPDLSEPDIARHLNARPSKTSLSNHLRKSLSLSPAKRALVFELTDAPTRAAPTQLAAALKALPLTLTAAAPLDEAISTRGGVAWSALDENLMLKQLPGMFCAGEMIDWDAPTGGYLITACLATGRAAAENTATWIDQLKT